MKINKLLIIISLAFISKSCKDEDSLKNIFSIDSSHLKQQYKLDENLDLSILNEQNKTIDSVVYFINDKKIGKVLKNEKFNFSLANQKLGINNLKSTVYFENKNEDLNISFEIFASQEPKLLEYIIVNTFSHDGTAYTQGLEFYNGILLEGTGQHGTSSLRKTDYKSGNVSEKINLEAQYFGEGITVLKDKLYQLTWQERTVFIYDAKTFKKEKTFTYETDGWGITNDGTYLYRSDGSEKIYKINPETFEVIDVINVYTNANKIENINELEWINGKIWANIYEQDSIIIIDPKTGVIENVINFSELKTKINKPLQGGEVLNGIAYNPKTNTIFVTGKNWDKMFEIKIK